MERESGRGFASLTNQDFNESPAEPSTIMELRETTRTVLAQVEKITGFSAVVVAEGDMPVLSTVSMASPARPSHVIRYHPSIAEQVDYFVTFQCGFVLRHYDVPPEDRRQCGPTESGKYNVDKLLRNSPAKSLSSTDLLRFAVFWMAICLTPCLDGHIHYSGFRFGGVILADAYSFWSRSSYGATLLPIHTSLATLCAIVAAVLQHLRERRKDSTRHTTRRTYGIGTLLLATAVLAAICKLLSAMGAPAVVFGCVLMAAAGHFVSVIAVGLLDRNPPPADDEQ